MRPALAALALAALAAAPVLAQTSSLAVIEAPTYTVGDFWKYRVVFIAAGAGNGTEAQTFPQDQTVRVVAIEPFQGTEAYRLFTESVQDIPGDPQSGDIHATSNKTTWASVQGHRILRIEEEVDRTQATAQYRILTHREINWTFHQPMDLYQFPIVRDDAWVVVTNATVESNTTLRTHVVGNNATQLPPRYESGNITQSSTTTWIRQDQLNLSGRTYQGVVLVSRSGNATIRDFWSPQVGNLVRREILNESAVLVETSTLVDYRFAKAPGADGRPDGSVGASGTNWVLLGGAAVGGILVALGLLALVGRLRKQPDMPPAAPPGEAPAAPPAEPPAAGEGPPPPPGQP